MERFCGLGACTPDTSGVPNNLIVAAAVCTSDYNRMMIGSVRYCAEDSAFVTDQLLGRHQQTFRIDALRDVSDSGFGERVGKPVSAPVDGCDTTTV